MAAIVRFDRFEVDLRSGELRKNGVRIHLRDQAFRILALLLEEPGQVVTREDLRRRLWPDDVVVDFENNLNHAVARVRAALGDSAERPRFIETLPKRGYRFIGAAASASSPDEQPRARVRVLVLPFVNLSGEPDQEYLSDSITQEMITALAAMAPERLGVIARTTAMRYKATQKAIGQIGRELRIDYIVEGEVRRENEQVTITTQLVQLSDQTQLASRMYQSRLDKVFELSHDMTQAICAQIGVPAIADAAGLALRRPTTNVDAYALYLRGRSQIVKETPESFAAAKECLEEAIHRDPRFAAAYDALAELHWYLGFLGLVAPNDVMAKGMFYAIRALEIDDTLAETHALLGQFFKQLDFNWAEVKAEMDRARKINAASPYVRLRYSIGWLLPTCQLADAVDEIELALELDPQSTLMRSWLAVMMWLNREYDRSEAQARLLLEFDPAAFTAYFALGLALSALGRSDEAIAAHRKAVELSGGSPLMLGWLALAVGLRGDPQEARRVLDQLNAASRSGYVPPTSFAWTYYGLSEVDEAFIWMDRAVAGRDPMIVPIRSYWFLDPIRQDPRYTALLHKLNYDTPIVSTSVIASGATTAGVRVR